MGWTEWEWEKKVDWFEWDRRDSQTGPSGIEKLNEPVTHELVSLWCFDPGACLVEEVVVL